MDAECGPGFLLRVLLWSSRKHEAFLRSKSISARRRVKAMMEPKTWGGNDDDGEANDDDANDEAAIMKTKPLLTMNRHRCAEAREFDRNRFDSPISTS